MYITLSMLKHFKLKHKYNSGPVSYRIYESGTQEESELETILAVV